MKRFVVLSGVILCTLLAKAEPPAEKKAAEPEHKKLAIYTQKPPKAAVGESELSKLQIERYATAREAVDLQMKSIEAGNWDVNTLGVHLATVQRLVKSYNELEPTKDEKLAMLANHLELATELVAMLSKRFNKGELKKSVYLQASYAKVDAEIMLTKAKTEK